MSTTTDPLVSVVIPVCNGERYLREALESVFAQGHRPIEVIVIDDGSTDNSAEIASSFDSTVSVIRQQNQGPAAARNRGIEASSGEFIAFLDADDLWLPEKLDRQVAHFKAHPDLDIVGARQRNFWMPEVSEEQGASSEDDADGQSSQVLLIRRSAFDRVGLLDERLAHRDAMDWLLRARDAGLKSDELPDVLVHRRIHQHNRSRKRGDRDREDMLRIVQASLSRRRGTTPPLS